MASHDLHTHTSWSDGARSVAEQVFLADSRELDALAITDHLFAGQRLADPGALDAYLGEIGRAATGAGTLVLAGIEATALDCSGAVSIGPSVAERLDWVLCDLSGLSAGTLRDTPATPRALAENVIRTYHGLCDLPYVDCIAHPFNTGRASTVALPADYPVRLLDGLASHMAETGTIFDLMNLMPWWFAGSVTSGREFTVQYVELVRVFARRGVRFQVSSDDHRCGLGNTAWSELVLARAGVPESSLVSRTRLEARRAGRAL